MVNCINIFIRVKSTLDCFRVLIGVCQVYFFRNSAIGFIDFLYDLYLTDCSFFIPTVYLGGIQGYKFHVYICAFVCTGALTTCMCVKRPEVDIKVSFPIALHLFIFKAVLFNLMLTSKTQAPLVSSSSVCHYAWLFMWVLEI